jgi:hypothetical protein
MSRQANPETILYRQNRAVTLAGQNKHKLGKWQPVPGRENLLAATCSKPNCKASVSVNTEFGGTYAGPSAFSAQCPYLGKP